MALTTGIVTGQVSPDNEAILYCRANLRVLNSGGAGATLVDLDVITLIGSNRVATSVNDRVGGSIMFGTNGYGDLLYTAYVLEDQDGPVRVDPYGGVDIDGVTAELETMGRAKFTATVLESPPPVAQEIWVGYLLKFADGSTSEVSPQKCAHITPP